MLADSAISLGTKLLERIVLTGALACANLAAVSIATVRGKAGQSASLLVPEEAAREATGLVRRNPHFDLSGRDIWNT